MATTAASAKMQRKGLGMAAATVEKKRTFNAVFTLKVTDYALQYSNRAAAQMYADNNAHVRILRMVATFK